MLFAKKAGPLALAVLCGSLTRAQNAPAFEAASLKLSGPDSSGGVSVTSTQWVWTKATLNQLIKVAFNVKDYSLSAPPWLDATEFDLVAKIPAGTPPGQPAKMLQTRWTPEAGAPLMAPGGAPDAAANPTGPSLFTALQEQLGLKLEARKVPVEVLVIDHAERTPVEN